MILVDMDYMKTNRKTLDEAPNGMYTITKIDEGVKDSIKLGVIFTLRQSWAKASKEQNPLFPYYMVYITDNGR